MSYATTAARIALAQHPDQTHLTLTPNALDASKCDSLASSSLHEMIHACANFKHMKCKISDGTTLGNISCPDADCKVCADKDVDADGKNLDKSYGCEAACYGVPVSFPTANSAACK